MVKKHRGGSKMATVTLLLFPVGVVRSKNVELATNVRWHRVSWRASFKMPTKIPARNWILKTSHRVTTSLQSNTRKCISDVRPNQTLQCWCIINAKVNFKNLSTFKNAVETFNDTFEWVIAGKSGEANPLSCCWAQRFMNKEWECPGKRPNCSKHNRADISKCVKLNNSHPQIQFIPHAYKFNNCSSNVPTLKKLLHPISDAFPCKLSD